MLRKNGPIEAASIVPTDCGVCCLRGVCQDFQNRLQVASQQVSAAHDSSEVFLCRELMEFFSDVLPLLSLNWHLILSGDGFFVYLLATTACCF